MKSKEKILIISFSLLAVAAGAGALPAMYYLVFDEGGPFGSGGVFGLGMVSVLALAGASFFLLVLKKGES